MNKIITLMSVLVLMTGIVLAVSPEGFDKVRISDSLPQKEALIEPESILPNDEGDTFVPDDPKEPDDCGVISPTSLTQWAECNPQEPDEPDDDGNGDNGGNNEGETINPSNPPGAWFTKYGWNGQECVKRDLVTKPGKTKHLFFKNPNLIAFGIEGEMFAYRVILGKRAFGWEPNPLTGFGSRVREPVCDETIIETDPLPVSWWRNSHNQSRYTQFMQ